MTTTDWNHLSLLIAQYVPWIVPFIAAVVAWLTHVAPFLQDKRVQALAAQAVAAAEQTIGDPAQRYAYVDGVLYDLFPRLSPDQRHAVIEGAVTALHMAIGTFTPATPPTPAQAAQTTQVQDDIAQIQQRIDDLAALVVSRATATRPTPTTKLARTERGTFTSGAAQVMNVPAAPADPTAPTGT